MKRTLAAVLLASVTMLTGACGDGDSPTSGDSNPDNQQTQQPGEPSDVQPS
ncbi:MAG TPA: hypothetical protein VM433_03730 [Mycobacteriales bacterium]|nr:hypothetical protein [Mycobacteriales bacterium]